MRRLLRRRDDRGDRGVSPRSYTKRKEDTFGYPLFCIFFRLKSIRWTCWVYEFHLSPQRGRTKLVFLKIMGEAILGHFQNMSSAITVNTFKLYGSSNTNLTRTFSVARSEIILQMYSTPLHDTNPNFATLSEVDSLSGRLHNG